MEDEELTRDSEWKNVHGEIKAVKDLEDSHILNLIDWLPQSRFLPKARDRWLSIFMQEARHRGIAIILTLKKLNIVPNQMPYVDPDGVKRLWNKKSRQGDPIKEK